MQHNHCSGYAAFCGMFISHCILNTGHLGSEWVLVGVANNSQRGTSERVKEKMILKSGADTQGLNMLS